MGARKWVLALFLLTLVAIFVPFVPQTQASGHILGAKYKQSSVVSPSYYAFHCGSYISSQLSASLGTFSSAYQVSKGYTFACNYNSG